MDWDKVFNDLNEIADSKHKIWRFGQENTIRWMADHLKANNGVLIADEVGMGKTRVCMALMLSVLKNGGKVAVLVPPGLIYQWKSEWEQEWKGKDEKGDPTPSNKEIEDLKGKYHTIEVRSYFDLFKVNNNGENSSEALSYPLSENQNKWLIISHNFGIPTFKSDKTKWLLPILASAIRKRKDGDHQGNRFMKFIKQMGWENDCLDEYCKDCSPSQIERCKKDIQLKNAAEYLANKKWGLFRNMEDIRTVEKARDFFKSEDGKWMLSALLGPVDLLVIDEAHKRKSEDSRLQNTINLFENKDQKAKEQNNSKMKIKRVAMTATPMELTPDEWQNIFKRIGESDSYPEKEISEFHNTRSEVIKDPQNPKMIYDLAEESRQFTKELKPFVTRRLRIKQDEMGKLLGINDPKELPDSAHPHRDYTKKISISFQDVSDEWKPSIFAFEALGKAAKGLNLEKYTNNKKAKKKKDDESDTENKSNDLINFINATRIYDSKYAAGYLKNPINDENVNLKSLIDDCSQKYSITDSDKAKLKRITYWWEKICSEQKQNTDLSKHPRIQIVADEIEKIVWNAENSEKVLVFGVFNQPLKVLAETLNARAILRLLDRKASTDSEEPPVPSMVLKNKTQKLWDEYQNLKNRHSSGVLPLQREYKDLDDLKNSFDKACKAYDKYLTKHINENFVETLPGDCALRNISNLVVELLQHHLVLELIFKSELFKLNEPKHIKNRALQIWCEYLDCWIDNENSKNNSKPSKTEWEPSKCNYFDFTYFRQPKENDKEEDVKAQVIAEIKKLDAFADNLGEKELKALIEQELYETSDDNKTGRVNICNFAQHFYGNTKMERRNTLKMRFNDKHAFPKVLVAQSQVGREGLNLHKACRTIIQFHAEWNPGVIEQQIGRVDRIENLWQQKVEEIKKTNPP